MVFDVFFFYRPEGPQADVEGDEDFFYAFIANLLEQFFRKMQACVGAAAEPRSLA